MLNPRALTHTQLAEIVADVQAILWQESRMLPDDPRQLGDYWNSGKEWKPKPWKRSPTCWTPST